ncbi:MAG TPA: signal peptidase I [Dehalococcoidia bacterium]|nr:signal peptidase I [Dehalococcoidia bacterium]
MKRALGLVIVVAVIIVVTVGVRGAMPFMAVLGDSMEPEFKAGDLITIEKVSYSEINVGDVVVVNVPPSVREAYNYPIAIAHRVVRVVEAESGISFRTRGDNTGGEDPFVVRSQDIEGKVGSRIPFLGFPLLYLQSKEGLVFIIVSLCIFTMYLYSNELNRARRKVQSGLLSPIAEASRSSNRVLEERIESTEQTLSRFSSAIEEYAKHLESHTSAIQGLSEASQELKKSAAEQNQVLARLLETTGQVSQKKDQGALEEKEPQLVEQSENGPHSADIQVPSGTLTAPDQRSSELERRLNDERRDTATHVSSGNRIQPNRQALIARLDAFIEALTPSAGDSDEADPHHRQGNEDSGVSEQGSE